MGAKDYQRFVDGANVRVFAAPPWTAGTPGELPDLALRTVMCSDLRQARRLVSARLDATMQISF